jgi:hypothetical protein
MAQSANQQQHQQHQQHQQQIEPATAPSGKNFRLEVPSLPRKHPKKPIKP